MGKFFKQTLASFIGSVAGLLFVFTLGATGFLILLVALLATETVPELEDKSTLIFDVTSQIKDNQSDQTLQNILSEDNRQNLSLRQITKAINKATQDEKISVIFLDGRKGNSNADYATLSEIRSALETFKKSGKKIISYHVNYGEKDYYLSSVADTIILNPMGSIEMNGFSSANLFFANALDKYGIGVQVIRAGKFKAAVEPFTRNNYSAENRLQNQELLTSLWSNYLQTITKSRNLSVNNIQNIANNKAIVNAIEAKNLKLIDQVAYFDEVVFKIQEIINNNNSESVPQIGIKKYLEATSQIEDSQNKIAVLYAEGMIVSGKGSIDQVGSTRFVKEIRKIREDDAIKGVVLRINSPGGSAIASEIILRELQLTAKEKPIIVSMGNLAASGGYWIATAGEKIFAEDATITGSIGVFGLLFNLEEIANNNGISYDVVKTNRFADLSGGLRPKTDAELQIYQQSVNRFYNLFLEKVAEARKLSKNRVDTIAQGRVWSGKQAKDIGLVDEIGGLETAIKYTSEKLNLGNDWQVEEYPAKPTWETEIIEKLSEAKIKHNLSEQELMTLAISELTSELDLEDIISNPNKVYAILPFKVDIK